MAVAVLVTASRLPSGSLYHFPSDDPLRGLGRMVVFLNYPTALVAIAILLVLLGRTSGGTRLAALAAMPLCLVATIPGVVSQSNLTFKAVNLVPVAGVALALAVTALAGTAGFAPALAGDRIRIVAGTVLVVAAIPWLFAETGFFAPDPILANEVMPGEKLDAVHRGDHEGMDGVLLALSALALSRVRPRHRIASALLALMLVYGIANALGDGWHEQVEKRGWSDYLFPTLLYPSIGLAWAVILAAAALVDLLWFSRERVRDQRRPVSARKSSSHSDIGT